MSDSIAECGETENERAVEAEGMLPVSSGTGRRDRLREKEKEVMEHNMWPGRDTWCV